jgi:hypothetical protein
MFMNKSKNKSKTNNQVKRLIFYWSKQRKKSAGRIDVGKRGTNR